MSAYFERIFAENELGKEPAVRSSDATRYAIKSGLWRPRYLFLETVFLALPAACSSKN